MESFEDLLQIPTAQESVTERWFQFTREHWHNTSEYQPTDYLGGNEQLDSDRMPDLKYWRRRQYHTWVNRYHHDEIPRLKWAIYDTDLVINQYVKSSNAEMRTAKQRAIRRRLEKRVCDLEEGWAKIIPNLRAQSETLFLLPREVRERIYGYLYTMSREIILDLPDPDVRNSLLPRDPYHYLSAAIVHPVIAAEAAQTLYDTNRISIEATCSKSLISKFLTTDHFGSGVCPGDIMRRLKLSVRGNSPHGNAFHHSHARFERGFYEIFGYWSEDRSKLIPVLDMSELRLLEIRMVSGDVSGVLELRILNPIIKLLMERGVAVRVIVEEEVHYWDAEPKPEAERTREISEYFRASTKDERKMFADPRPLMQPEIGVSPHGVVDSESSAGISAAKEKAARWRVFLDRHFQVWKKDNSDDDSGTEMSGLCNNEDLSDFNDGSDDGVSDEDEDEDEDEDAW